VKHQTVPLGLAGEPSHEPNDSFFDLPTEQRLEAAQDLDALTSLELVQLMHRQDRTAVAAVGPVLPQLAALVDQADAALQAGGCVHYFGAGTSGRLGVLDAVELVPTFSLPPDTVRAHLAGGEEAMFKAVENSEDSFADGYAEAGDVSRNDVVIGLTASGKTPYVVGAMVFQNTVGLGLAQLLHRLPRFKRLFQTLFTMPYLVSPLVIGYLWTLLLSPMFGPVNAALKAAGLDSWAVPWLGDPKTAIWVIVFINSWQWIGFPVLLYGAAMGGIPDELEEAAALDGANAWQKFSRITLPLLTPAIGTVTVLTFIGAMEAFAILKNAPFRWESRPSSVSSRPIMRPFLRG
jgi:ABC-type molybdate transport system permease subunit